VICQSGIFYTAYAVWAALRIAGTAYHSRRFDRSYYIETLDLRPELTMSKRKGRTGTDARQETPKSRRHPSAGSNWVQAQPGQPG